MREKRDEREGERDWLRRTVWRGGSIYRSRLGLWSACDTTRCGDGGGVLACFAYLLPRMPKTRLLRERA